MVDVIVGSSWRSMVPELARSLRGELQSPFATGRIIVDSAGSARLLMQALAQVDGIAAGVQALTIGQYVSELAEEADIAEEWRAWRSTRLISAIWTSLDEVSQSHPLLAAFLDRPGRRISAASRLARLFREYLAHSPAKVGAWPTDLPEELAWQPELWRGAIAELGIDPLALMGRLQEAASVSPVPTWVFCVDDIPSAWTPLVLDGPLQGVWSVDQSPAWLGASTGAITRTGKALRAVPRVDLHGSHSRLRQVEVLRDALTRAFNDDPLLEARDVRIVCPSPNKWSHLLNGVFRSDADHPGAALRVAEVSPSTGGNLVLEALSHALHLLDARATSSQVVEFLLRPAVAERWKLSGSRDSIIELVSAAQIRWGLDAAQRSRYGLPESPHNTWLSGLEALLTGIAMGDAIGPSGIAGTPEVGSNDLPLIGNLAEVVFRLRALGETSSGRMLVAEWAELLISTVDELFGLGHEDAWMLRQASSVLARIGQDHATSAAQFNRREFRRLLEAELPSRWHRAALGNGSLHVVSPFDARHVDVKLVAFLGIEELAGAHVPDAIDGWLPEPDSILLDALLAHARAADKVLVVTRSHSERTGAKAERPVTIDLMLSRLGAHVTESEHSPQPFNRSEFTRGSFDAAGFAGAAASARVLPPAIETRRHDAMHLPVGEPPAKLDIVDIERFAKRPLEGFLRSAAGVQWLSEASLQDEVPLEFRSLEKWKIGDAFLQGRLRHEDPQELIRRQRASQVMPPGALGDALARRIGSEVEQVVTHALPLLDGKHELHHVELDLGTTHLTGTVVLHGGRIVAPNASSGRNPLLLPWLQLLLLAADEVQATAVVLRTKDPTYAKRTTLTQPNPERARLLLGHFVDAHRQGQFRFVPAPWEPLSRMALEEKRNPGVREEWLNPKPGDWKKWYPGPLWKLFYANPSTDILTDPPLRGDAPSEFEHWVRLLAHPLVEHGGAW